MATPGPKSQRLSSEDVRHIALLCRIGLSDEEVERMRDQLSHILEQFQALQAVDTTGVEPTGHAVEVDSVMRDDEPRPPMSVDETLANAPRREGEYFRVQAVLE